ncbi:redoxin family protein [Blautia schinkii]|nr:redoxin family protein [Blautia schinkii]
MKHKKVKVLLLCLALAGVLAGCGADKDKKEESQVTASDNKTASTQEKTSTDSGVTDKDAGEAEKDDIKAAENDAEGTNDADEAEADGAEKDVDEAKNADKTKDMDGAKDAGGAGDAGETNDADETKADVGEASWIFTNEDLEGNEVTQDIFKDKKLTMVNYWATFCGPCLREMPDLGELQEEYADKGFQIVGVVADVMEDQNGELTNLDVAKEAVEATKAGYVHLPITQEMLGGPVANVQVVPTTVFVDENGNMVGEEQLGSKSKEDWAALIDSYLKMV